MSSITSHVLDTALGRPAQGVDLVLELEVQGAWRALGGEATNADGRARHLLPEGHILAAGIYRITFDVAPYFARLGQKSFYPHVEVVFRVENPDQHYHIPLLLSPFGYSTYRGS